MTDDELDEWELEQALCKFCGCCLGSWDDEAEDNACNDCHRYYRGTDEDEEHA